MINVLIDEPSYTQEEMKSTIFVCGLNPKTTEKELDQHFE
jgi:RNA recognition motif-containing protein